MLTEKLIRLLLEKKQLQGSTGLLMIREGRILFYPNGCDTPSVNREMVYARQAGRKAGGKNRTRGQNV